MSKVMAYLDNLMLKGRKYGELIVAAVLFLFFLGLRLFIGEFMNLNIKRWRFVSPAFWPGWALTFGAVLGAFLLYAAYKNFKAQQACQAAEQPLDEPCSPEERERRLREKFQKEGRVLSLRELEELAAAGAKAHAEQPGSRELLRLLSMVGLAFVYLYLIRIIGFLTSTALFGFAYLFVLKERRPLVLIIAPLAIVAVILIIFTKVLVVPLPRGTGFFRTISNFFY